LNGAARATEICEEKRAIEEEKTRADNDAAFELACRIVVMKSLPGWIEEICTEQLGTAPPIVHTKWRAFWRRWPFTIGK